MVGCLEVAGWRQLALNSLAHWIRYSQEKQATRFGHTHDLPHERLRVFDVFEHLHGNDLVDPAILQRDRLGVGHQRYYRASIGVLEHGADRIHLARINIGENHLSTARRAEMGERSVTAADIENRVLG